MSATRRCDWTALRLYACFGLLAVCLGWSGCSHFVILSYLLAGPPSVEPDFDSQTRKSMSTPGKKVAVVCFAPKELQWNHPQIDHKLAMALTARLAQHHIKVIPAEEVRAWTDEHPNWETAEEIGRATKADYVIEIELASYSLFEGTSTTLYRGRTEAYVHVVEMDAEGHGERIYTKALDFVFPTQVPRSSYDQTLSHFQKEYLSMLSERMGFLFYERYNGDMIHWAN